MALADVPEIASYMFVLECRGDGGWWWWCVFAEIQDSGIAACGLCGCGFKEIEEIDDSTACRSWGSELTMPLRIPCRCCCCCPLMRTRVFHVDCAASAAFRSHRILPSCARTASGLASTSPTAFPSRFELVAFGCIRSWLDSDLTLTRPSGVVSSTNAMHVLRVLTASCPRAIFAGDYSVLPRLRTLLGATDHVGHVLVGVP